MTDYTMVRVTTSTRTRLRELVAAAKRNKGRGVTMDEIINAALDGAVADADKRYADEVKSVWGVTGFMVCMNLAIRAASTLVELAEKDPRKHVKVINEQAASMLAEQVDWLAGQNATDPVHVDALSNAMRTLGHRRQQLLKGGLDMQFRPDQAVAPLQADPAKAETPESE